MTLRGLRSQAKLLAMLAQDLRRDLSRRYYVSSRTTRTAALHLAYAAYARTLPTLAPGVSAPEAGKSLRERIERLFAEDWQDAEEGIYPRSLIDGLPWAEYARATPTLLLDLPRTRKRINERDSRDLDPSAAPERYPEYYARNFHFQTEGYLGHTSARLYDLQVELLFGGTADAMRRRLLSPLVQFARARQAEAAPLAPPLRVLDVACGTGHFLHMLGAALPDASLCGLDLSPHYLARAREMLSRDLNLSLVCDNAEKMPFRDATFDAVSSVFLFHELPAPVGDRVLGEIARVVRPGGRVVVGDSLQLRDAPELKAELEGFPARFHEPFYPKYIRGDLAASVERAGLRVHEVRTAFLTKLVIAERPGTAASTA